MTRSELYEDLNDILSSYQYYSDESIEDNKIDASDLYRMLVKIQSNWNAIVTD